MDPIIKEIIDEVRVEFPNLSLLEIERMFDTEWKVLENGIQSRTKKTINMIYLGKFKPSTWFIKNYDKVAKKSKANIPGLEK